MDDKMCRIKCLLLTGPDMYIIPGLAIAGIVGIVAAAGYGIYTFFKNEFGIAKETDETIKSLSEIVNKEKRT